MFCQDLFFRLSLFFCSKSRFLTVFNCLNKKYGLIWRFNMPGIDLFFPDVWHIVYQVFEFSLDFENVHCHYRDRESLFFDIFLLCGIFCLL